MAVNKDATRYFSDKHEQSVCRALDAKQTANSGAGRFEKLDVIQAEASLGIECKCCMDEKKSVSIKKEWIDKSKEEAFRMRLDNATVCINFKPNGPNYYLIDEKLMKFLTDKLIKENIK